MRLAVDTPPPGITLGSVQMNLRGIKIGTRLAMGFASVLTLLAIAVIGGNLANKTNLDRLTQGLHAATAKADLAEKMKGALLEVAVATRNIGLQQDVAATQHEELRIKDLRKRYADARDRLLKLGATDVENGILEKLTQLDRQTEKPFLDAIGLSLVFDMDSAAKIITTQIDPVNQQSLSQINQLVDLQKKAQQAALTATTDSATRFSVLLYALGAAALAIGLTCAFMITRSITRPLADAVSLARTVSKGDLSAAIEVSGKDETADLMVALRDMADSLAGIVGNVRASTEGNCRWQRQPLCSYRAASGVA
jgi:methyl-accepting chemotaxis protein